MGSDANASIGTATTADDDTTSKITTPHLSTDGAPTLDFVPTMVTRCCTLSLPLPLS